MENAMATEPDEGGSLDEGEAGLERAPAVRGLLWWNARRSRGNQGRGRREREKGSSGGEEPDGKRARTEGNGAGVGDSGDVDGAAAAVAYGKEHFEKFTRLRDSKEANEVRRLMAAAVYARVGLENSPYKDIERECREIGGVLNPYTFDPDLRKRMEETAKGTEEDLADFEEIGSAWW